MQGRTANYPIDNASLMAASKLATEHEVEIKNLKEWQTKQNGSLQKLDEKYESIRDDLRKMVWAMLIIAMTSAGSLLMLLIQKHP
jgi:hypothetical protein